MNYESEIAKLSDAEVFTYAKLFESVLSRDFASTPQFSVVRSLFAEAGIDAVDLPQSLSDADLARAVLTFLVQQEQFKNAFGKMLSSGPSKRFALLETAGIVTLAIAALQTHIKFERNSDGVWSLKIEKKALESKAVVDLMKKLLTRVSDS